MDKYVASKLCKKMFITNTAKKTQNITIELFKSLTRIMKSMLTKAKKYKIHHSTKTCINQLSGMYFISSSFVCFSG
ncbi:MAG: hypothetical protein LBQ24_02870 [Candidatus Peribacteria bacterium]|nr:hypothetical protein [Candidatus Peribacteria bacterium]